MASNDLELALRIRAAFEGQQALTNLATSFVDINKKVETLMRGLQAISGSAEGAAKEFTYLEETSKKFGLSVIDLADNYVKLSASAKETNLEGEATRKLFEATSATMAVLGGDTVTTERAFRALGQIMSKGQVYAEELKGQLAEAIPGALQIMSRGLGISTNEMLRLMEAGQLSADVLLPFATQLEKEYGNLASSSTTFAQAINRIQTEWTLLMKRLGDTGAWSALSSAMNLVGKNSELIAGAIGVGLVAASVKAISVTKGLAVSIIDSVRSFQLQGTAAEVAAKAVLDKANADALAATRAVQSAEASAASARASLLSATTAANAANAGVAAQERLVAATIRNQLASEGLSAAKIKETEALITANLAANNYARSQSVMSRSMALLTGPAGMIALIIAGFAAMAYAFRDQDEATKTLSKSTEEYTQEIEKLTAAQLALLESKANEGVDDNKQRIQNIKDEIDYLNKRLEKEREGIAFYEARKLSVYGVINSLKVWLSTEELLTQAQADLDEATNQLTINEGKQALAITELASRYDELIVAEKNHSKTVADTSADINEQRKSIDSARSTMYEMISTYGVWSKEAAAARANVGKATEGLIALQEKQTNQAVVLKNTQDQSTKAIDAYVKATGASHEVVLAGLSGDQQAIDKLDAKSKAIALSVQSLLRLTDEEKALAAQVKLTRSELEKYEKVQLSGVDAKLREAEAIGDLNAIRQAEIEKAKVQQSVAQQSLALEQTILRDKQKQLAIDEQLYQQNEKGRPKTQERINKLKLEITAQEGVIAQKQADIVVTSAQADAVIRANTLLGDSFQKVYDEVSSANERIKKETNAANSEIYASLDRLNENVDLNKEKLSLARQEYILFRSMGEDKSQLEESLDFIRLAEDELITSTQELRVKTATITDQIAKNWENAKERITANLNDLPNKLKSAYIAAFTAVGLSYEEVMDGMDFETRRQIDAFGALGDQAKVTSGDLQNAFTNILANANTVAELDELARTLESLGANGKVAGDQVAVGLAAIDLKAAELINSLDPVQQSLEKLGVGVPERLEAIAQQNEVLYAVIKKSKAPIDEVDKAFLKYAESQLLAAEHGAKIDAAALKNEASTRGLSAAFAELQRKLAETDPEIAALVEAMDRYNTMVQRTNALNEQHREVNNQVIESQKGIAEIIGDKNKVAEEEAKLAAQAVQDSIQRINDLEEEKDAIDGLIKKLIEKQQAEGLNPEEMDSLQQYQDEAQARQLVIDKVNEELLLKQKLAEQAAIEATLGNDARTAEAAANAITIKVAAMEKELEMTLKLQQQKVTDEQQDLDLLETDKELLVVAKEGLEAELEKAVVEKDVDEQNEIRLKIADNLIKQAEQEVKIAEQKVEVAKELVAMSKAEQQAAIEKAKAYREAAEAQKQLLETERARFAEDGFTQEEKEQLANIEARIAGLKSQAISEDAAADAAQAAIKQGQKQTEIAEKSVDVAKKRVEAAKAEKEALDDQINAQNKDTDSKNKNTKSTKSNTNAKQDAEQAARDLANALEEQRKADEEAAQAERERLKAMNEAAEEAQREVDTLKADLLKETGFDQEADLLAQMVDYQTKREQLAKAIEAAEGQGNKALVAALNQQLSLIDKINAAKVKNIQDSYAQEQADRELEATQKIADATQQLTDIIDAAAQERLDIEADHLKSIDQLHEQANADRLAKIQQNKLDQKNADAEYGQARKDQEQATNNEIQSLRDDHQQSLTALEKDYQSSVLNEQADLTQSLESVNQESANSVKRLYEDSANSINEINQDIAEELNDVTDNLSKDLVGVTEDLSKDLLGVTKDLTQDLNDLTNDLAKDLEDISKNLVSSMEDAAKELDRDFFTSDRDNARKIEELYRDLDRSIADRQKDTQAELLSLEKDRADKIDKLRKDAAESARKDNQRINQEELNDKIQSIQEEFAEKKRKTVEESKLKIVEDQQDAAVKESNLIEDLEYKKKILQEEYELERIELARLAEEKRIDAEQAAEEKRVALEQEAVERRAALEQEAAERREVLQQEAVEKRADIEVEKQAKIRAIQEEVVEKKAAREADLKEALANLEIESQARLASLQEAYLLNQQAKQQESNEAVAELHRESEAKLAILSKEHEAKRQLLQAEQTLALRSINDTYQAELLLLNQQTQAELAEAKKKADQSVLLAQENIQTIQQQIEFELSLARAKDAQAESQVRLNYSMRETLALTKSISEQMGALASSSLSGLSQQADTLRRTLQDIDTVL